MLTVLYTLLGIYILGGFFYALYIAYLGVDKWFYFPLNMLLGPLILILNKYLIKKGRLGFYKRPDF